MVKYYTMKKILFRYIAILCALLTLCDVASYAQGRKKENTPITVSGRITSESGFPMTAVQVTVQDSFIRTETDDYGSFTITVPKAGDIIVCATDYYDNLYVTVKTDDFLNLVMIESIEGQGEDDDVLLPFRTGNKRNLTAAVSTVGSDVLEKSPVVSLGNALSGRVPGLFTRQKGGSPGDDEAELWVRGVRTLWTDASNAYDVYGSATPLIIVDGFERSFADLDASEIESFSILKDAAATAIYGVKGANGVILVNTKRGITNKRTIDLNVNTGLHAATYLPEYLNSYDYATLYNEARINDGLSALYTQEDLDLYKSGADPVGHPDNDYYNEFLKKYSYQTKANLSMRGGNDKVKYFVDLAALTQESLFAHTNENPSYKTPQNYQRYNVRSNLDVTITKWLSLALDVAGRIEERNYSSSASSILSAMQSPPNAYPLSFMGVHPDLNLEMLMLGGTTVYKDNPLDLLNYSGYTNNTRRYFQATAKLKADLSKFITKGLSLEASYYLDGYNSYSVVHSQSQYVWQRTTNADGTYKYTPFGSESSLSTDYSSTIERYNGLDISLHYDRTFNRHNVKGMLVYNRSRMELANDTNVPDDKYENLAAYAGYSFADKYYIDATLSYSGTDTYWNTKSLRTLYPAVGAAWVISGENFLKNSKAVDYLKLRASWGISGNDAYNLSSDSRYPARTRWWTSGSKQKFGQSLTTVQVVYEGRMANTDITIEKGQMINVGLDGEMFNHQLSFSIDGWKEHRYDIYTVSTGSSPSVLGVQEKYLPITNDGILDSWGVDGQIAWRGKAGDFTYGIVANGEWYDTKIVNMAEPVRDYDNLVQTGNQIGRRYGMVCLGLFKDQDDVDNSPVQQFGTYGPGDLKYKDINGDGVVDSNDMVASGDCSTPRLVAGLEFSFGFKNFDLSFQWVGATCCSVYISDDSARAFNSNGGVTTFALGRYQTYADGSNNWATANYPKLSTASSSNNYRESNFWEYDGSYLRLKNVELGYNFPSKWLKSRSLSGIRLYLTGFNLLTFSKLTKYNYDPEDIKSGRSRYPMEKIASFGINLTF